MMTNNSNQVAQGLTIAPPEISTQAFSETYPRKIYEGPKPVVLLVLDGWGIGPKNEGNAIIRARTPNLNRLWVSFPHTQLEASGEAVGLTREADGNTETGHMNIGAGTIIYQFLPRLNASIADGSFDKNQAFQNAFNHVRKNNSNLHIMGLIGSGGVHSNIEHLYALLNLCRQEKIKNVFIHGFTDGRDSPPTTGIKYVSQILDTCKKLGFGKFATIMGRYYAMDRDKRWERIEKAYNAMVLGVGACTKDPLGAMQKSYDQNTTDEYIEPISVCDESGAAHLINDNDACIFFNFRVDRPRELTRAFVMPDFEEGIKQEDYDPHYEKYNKTSLMEKPTGKTFQRKKILKNLYFVTMSEYEEGLPVDIAFQKMRIKDNIGRIMATNGIRQLRTTETEKGQFITDYINGQQKIVYPGQTNVIYTSRGVKSYDEVPEMCAYEIAATIIDAVRKESHDFIMANIANPDMIGHTGNLQAGIKACEYVDDVVGKIITEVMNKNGIVIVTADHGNIEEMINTETGQADTEHSTFPVPFIVVGKQYMNNPRMLPTGILADIIPTCLNIMKIPKPESMTGRALL